MKRSLISLLMMILLTPFTLHAAGEKVSTIVIDPGHGGKDAGAVGKNCYEKDIALKVALKFGELINQNFPDVKVIYTRKDDRFVELRQRGRIANQNHADLFVSIHCNSNENKEAKGVETWIMGNHKNDANLKVAQLENSAILQEQNHEENYDNFDPNSPDAYIIFSLYQNAFMDQSLGFAAKVQEQYGARVPSPNRGIKQAGFLVLWSCALPSVLTEIGFISNPAEEKFLNSADGQLKIATSLFNAFKEYKYQVEGFNNQAEATKTPAPAVAPASKPVPATATQPPNEPAKPASTATPPSKPVPA
ncbi:MAG: N-acetylmuramoyl-L-alanine amidase, partial [Bacteroidales bacterium]|nr:N-acetylmuramoyl-L-alanine amidase [Bacteroidales bacterium]